MSSHPFVVKLGGALLDRPETAGSFFSALARLHRERREGVVVVHGGGAAVDRPLSALGFETERREGIRITPPEQIEAIAGVLAGSMNKRLVGILRALGLPAVGLCLGDAGVAECRPSTAFPFDPGRVGEICGGRPRLLEVLLAEGFLPVLSSIGLDGEGGLLNVNADDAAAGLAKLLRARELVLLTDVSGVLGPDGSLLPRLDATEIARGIEEGWIAGGMIAKVRGALAAAEAARVPVRIASWAEPASLLALLDGHQPGACGTCVDLEVDADSTHPERIGSSP
ncbi:MAG: acetylglutamate kinase [Phycisphaerales bacterium]